MGNNVSNSGAGKVAAPTLSRAKIKFKNCDNYACQNPKTTMQGLHVEKSVITHWHAKYVDVLTHQIDIGRKPKRAH